MSKQKWKKVVEWDYCDEKNNFEWALGLFFTILIFLITIGFLSNNYNQVNEIELENGNYDWYYVLGLIIFSFGVLVDFVLLIYIFSTLPSREVYYEKESSYHI